MSTTYTEIILTGFILLLPFLYESSHVFRYNLKFFVYYFFVSCCSVILIPFYSCRPKNVRNLLIASTFCNPVSTLLGLQWFLRGKEYLEKEQGCIIVANHQSSLDILGMFNFWHVMDKCTVVAKRELLYSGPFGLAAWLCGLIFIPRMQSDAAKKIMADAAKKIKREKIKLWIFPEGTRHNTGEIHPFKKGAFHLAITSQLPILPIIYSQYYFLDDKNRRFDHGGKVIVTALPPIETEGMTLDDMSDLMEDVKTKMSHVFQDINNEMRESLSTKSVLNT